MSLRACAHVVAVPAIALVVGCDDDPVSSVVQYEHSDTEVHSFAVGDPASVVADTFVGSVTFTQGDAGTVQVTVTKWANLEADLDLLHVESSQLGDEIQVTASNPDDLKAVAVDLEITGPPETVLDLASGVGPVACTGRPGSRWGVDVGVGSAKLAVPADVNVSVELMTGVGRVSVDFDVEGQVLAQSVVGVIGTGDEGDIVAHVGVGSIRLDRR